MLAGAPASSPAGPQASRACAPGAAGTPPGQPPGRRRSGDGFLHHVVVQPAADRGELHVYIEGDGTPWIRGTAVAKDPTPKKPLALRLMRRDPAFSAYVGRPCYFGVEDPACTPALWTSRRYSKEVVSSMHAVIRRLLDEHGAKKLVLIGHSGGGTLAVLLAPGFDETAGVITIGANLDVAAWTAYHGYTPLEPVELAPLPPRIRQLHLAGGRDRNVPPRLAEQAAERLGGQLAVTSRFDHDCCWERRWPEILRYFHQTP